jgi:hypothetical protein
MDRSSGNARADAKESRGWLRRITNKSGAEIATDATLLVMGVVVMYAIDPLFMSRAPLAFQYLVQFLVYLNQHAISAVNVLY